MGNSSSNAQIYSENCQADGSEFFSFEKLTTLIRKFQNGWNAFLVVDLI